MAFEHATPEVFRPRSEMELIEFVKQSSGGIAIRGAGTKAPLVTKSGSTLLVETSGLQGIADYQPTEFTISALSGTPVSTIHQALKQQGQYLAFDPPWENEGATIGGAVASGISGPSRLLYGGIRDFVLGIRFVDGLGQHVTGGGKVVKNAAGFDLPKMFVGSCGTLGLITELTLKVFPRPKAYCTLIYSDPSFERLCNLQANIMRLGVAVAAMDLLPGKALWVRLAGPLEAVRATSEALGKLQTAELISTEKEERQLWQNACDARWLPEDHLLIKVPTSPRSLKTFEQALAIYSLPRRYSSAGNVAWLGWPQANSLASLDRLLFSVQHSGLVIRGTHDFQRLGVDLTASLSRRIREAIDPQNRFGRI